MNRPGCQLWDFQEMGWKPECEDEKAAPGKQVSTRLGEKELTLFSGNIFTSTAGQQTHTFLNASSPAGAAVPDPGELERLWGITHRLRSFAKPGLAMCPCCPQATTAGECLNKCSLFPTCLDVGLSLMTQSHLLPSVSRGEHTSPLIPALLACANGCYSQLFISGMLWSEFQSASWPKVARNRAVINACSHTTLLLFKKTIAFPTEPSSWKLDVPLCVLGWRKRCLGSCSCTWAPNQRVFQAWHLCL